MAELGNAVINILVDVNGTKQAQTKLVQFFANISTSINGLTRGVEVAKRALDGMGTGQFAKDAKLLGDNLKTTAVAANKAGQALSKLKSKLDPVREATLKYKLEIRKLNQLKRDGVISAKTHAAVLAVEENNFIATARAAREAAKSLTEMDKARKKVQARRKDSAQRGKLFFTDTSPALAKLKADMKDARNAAKAMGKSVSELNKVLNRLKLAAKGEQLTKLGQNMRQVSFALRDAGRQMIFFGAALIGALAPAVLVNAEFEQSVVDVVAIIGEFEDKEANIDRLSDAFLRLGEQTIFTAVEIANAAKQLALAGFSTTEIEQSIEAIANLSAASNTALATSAQIAVNITRAFGVSASNFTNVADTLVAVATNSSVTIESLGESFKLLGPIAASTGQSIEDVTTALGILGNAGIRGGRAGTSLSRFFSELLEKSDEIDEALRKVGSSFEAVDPTVHGIGEIIRVLTELESLGKIDTKTFFELFDQRSGRAVLSLVNQGTQAFTELNEELETSAGLAKKIAKIELDTLLGDWKILISNVTTAMNTLGEVFNKTLRSVMQAVTQVVQGFTKWVEANPVLVKTLAEILVAAGGLSLVLGSIALAAGSMIAVVGVLILTFGGFTSALASTAAGMIGLQIAFPPLIVVFGALAAAVAILVGTFEAWQQISSVNANQLLADDEDRFLSAAEAMDSATDALRDFSEAYELQVKLAQLNPVEFTRLFEVLSEGSPVLRYQEELKGLNDELANVEAALADIAPLASGDTFLAGLFDGLTLKPVFDTIYGSLSGESRLAQLLEKDKEALNDLVSDIEVARDKYKLLITIQAAGFKELAIGIDKVKEAITKQQAIVRAFESKFRRGEATQEQLDTEEKLLDALKEALDVTRTQLIATQQELDLTKAIALAEQQRTAAIGGTAQEQRDAADAVAKALLAEKEYIDTAGKRKALLESRLSLQGDFNDREKERAKESLSEHDKELELIREKFELEAASLGIDIDLDDPLSDLLDTGLIPSQILQIEEFVGAISKARELLAANIQLGKSGEVTAANRKFIANLEERLKEVEAEKNAAEDRARKLSGASDAEVAKKRKAQNEEDAKAAKKKEDSDTKALDIAELANAKREENISEEIRLTKKLREAANRAAVDKIADPNTTDPKELKKRAKLAKALAKKLASDLKKIQDAFDKKKDKKAEDEKKGIEDAETQTKRSELAAAKAREDIKEEIRLTTELREAEIKAGEAKILLRTKDAALAARFRKAEEARLANDIKKIKDAANKSKQSKARKASSGPKDIQKERLSTQSKITDALLSQATSLREILFINRKIGQMERGRFAAQERGRKAAISLARKLQAAVDKGQGNKAFSLRSELGARLAFNRSQGVSELAQQGASFVFDQAGIRTPKSRTKQKSQPKSPKTTKPTAGLPGGAAVNFNSNNTTTTLNIDPGAIVVNSPPGTSASDIATEIGKQIFNILSQGNGP